MSFVFFTHHSKKLAIGCPACLKSENNLAVGLSLFLGWWGIPWGPIRTIQSISNFFTANSAIGKTGPNDYLRGFVLANIGLFTLHKDAKDKISMMINNVHNNKLITSEN